MIPAAALRALLRLGRVPASALGRHGKEALAVLFETGALDVERSGGGRVIVVRRLDPVQSFVACHFPSGLEMDDTPVTVGTPRAAGVAAMRDAKRAGQAAVEPVLIRAFRPVNCTRQTADGLEKALDLLALTRLAGVVAITLEAETVWSVSGRIGVVENLECFYHAERMDTEIDVAIYAGGRLSARVVRWLAGETMREASIVHLGDYDPVGLAEYLRLKAACGARVRLCLPSDLRCRMRRYGKRSLLTGRNATLLASLRKSSDPVVREVVGMMDETGCGLEQESLLLPQRRI